MIFSAAMTGLAALLLQPVETVVEAPAPAGPLQGAMLRPAAPQNAPVVLIIPGSGPTDRDGNVAPGLRPATYRLLAQGLAERGIATVRIDKRGMFGSHAALADANAVTIDDYAADVRSWVRTLRASTGAPCIWLLGHSEGGLVAIAAREGDDICGLLLVASPGRPLGQLLREQLRSNPANAPLLDQALSAIDRLEAGGRVDTSAMHPALLALFAPPVQSYLMDLLPRDPAALLRGYAGPVLVVQPQRDLQVGEADARRLAAAVPQARLVMIPDASHVLKPVASDDRMANIATYSDQSLPLAPGIVDAIADFVEARGSPR